ncbi:MAG: hypothetical protein Q4A75_07135 [Peptostreptococcaceae bacterium]|nr:hypothetical protein [Peptostreptococcaceae bacterium]
MIILLNGSINAHAILIDPIPIGHTFSRSVWRTYGSFLYSMIRSDQKGRHIYAFHRIFGWDIL